MKKDPSFYDFLPYRFGPFSFVLYRELGNLRQNGYVTYQENSIAPAEAALALVAREADQLPASIQTAVADILCRYGKMDRVSLVRTVYTRYSWFALNSKLPERRLASVQRPNRAPPAVYTAGYEGKSVDAFFNYLMQQGIEVVIDVRANPLSRKYGFSRPRFDKICKWLGFEYRHLPGLGIPSSARAGLSDFASYQRLLHLYEQAMLPEHSAEVEEVARLVSHRPSVLVCVEKDVRCCHRSRLAGAVAKAAGLKVIHL